MWDGSARRGDSRVRGGLAVGCLEGGSGGCGTSDDEVVLLIKSVLVLKNMRFDDGMHVRCWTTW